MFLERTAVSIRLCLMSLQRFHLGLRCAPSAGGEGRLTIRCRLIPSNPVSQRPLRTSIASNFPTTGRGIRGKPIGLQVLL